MLKRGLLVCLGVGVVCAICIGAGIIVATEEILREEKEEKEYDEDFWNNIKINQF